MKKLKCWKKGKVEYGGITGSISFQNIKTRDFVGIYKKYNRNWETLGKKFKSKSQALKFANKYMKKNDKC